MSSNIVVVHFASDISKESGGFGSSIRSLLLNLSGVPELYLALFTFSHCFCDSDVRLNKFIFNRLRWFNNIISIISALRKTVKREENSIFHCHSPWSLLSLFAIFLAPFFRAKVFVSTHGMFDPWCLRQKRLKKRFGVAFYRIIARHFIDAYVVNSDLERKSVLMLFPTAKVYVVNHGISMSHVLAEEIVKMRYESKNYLFLSRIVPGKGLEELMNSWLDCSLEGASLLVAGSGEPSYVARFTDFVSENNLACSVSFLGFIDSPIKEKIYNESKFFILPSHSENFGMVVLEAMSMGVPCIVSDKTPWTNVAVDGLGYLVSNTAASISIALNDSSVVDYESYLKMSGLAFAYAKNYSWESIIPKYFELYESSFLS